VGDSWYWDNVDWSLSTNGEGQEGKKWDLVHF
jgi:hypothetical protein